MLHELAALLSNGWVIPGAEVVITPTDNSVSTAGVRPFSGRSSTDRVVITCPTDAFAWSTSGASPDTVIVSPMLPTVIDRLTMGCACDSKVMPLLLRVSNPCLVAVMEYSPGKRNGTTYC